MTFAAFGVILVTLILQGMTPPLVLEKLGVEPPEGELLEHASAEAETANVGR